jgi:hypothetical protein
MWRWVTLCAPPRANTASPRQDKRENFERLLREGKLGGLAVLRNLRLMLASGVEPKLIRERLDKGTKNRAWLHGCALFFSVFLCHAKSKNAEQPAVGDLPGRKANRS